MSHAFPARNAASLHQRRRRRLPIWHRYWQRLTIAQQERVKSISLATSLHLFLVAILAAISLATPQLTFISFECSFASQSTADTITMLAETDVQDVMPEEIKSLDVTIPEIPQPFEGIDSIDLSLVSHQTHTVPGTQISSDLSAIKPVSSFIELTTDSQRIAETNRRVAAAGGQLHGPIRISLIFSGDDDIDLHVQYQEVGRRAARFGTMFPYHVFFQNPRTPHAMLDVDANAVTVVPDPCENIIFSTTPKSGNYIVAIHHYQPRGEIVPTPYIVVVNYGKTSKVFKGTILPQDGVMKIWQFKYSH